MTVDLTEATLGQDGQIIITGEDGQGDTQKTQKYYIILINSNNNRIQIHIVIQVIQYQ